MGKLDRRQIQEGASNLWRPPENYIGPLIPFHTCLVFGWKASYARSMVYVCPSPRLEFLVQNLVGKPCLDHGVGLVSFQDKGWTCSVAALHLVLPEQPTSVEIHPEDCVRS